MNIIDIFRYFTTIQNIQGETLSDESIADVLLWSIFVNRQELAEICWLRGKDQLCKFNYIKQMYIN